MDIEELVRRREAAYGDAGGQYNTVAELIDLRRHGYLVGGSAEGTPRDWTDTESAEIKQAFKHDEYRTEISELFPAEAREAADERREL